MQEAGAGYRPALSNEDGGDGLKALNGSGEVVAMDTGSSTCVAVAEDISCAMESRDAVVGISAAAAACADSGGMESEVWTSGGSDEVSFVEAHLLSPLAEYLFMIESCNACLFD